MDLPIGKIKAKLGGGSGGHNGLKNIIAHLGHDGFVRVKMGVGEKPKGYDLADYVLGHFSKEERAVMDQAAVKAADAIRMIIIQDPDAAMNEFNRKA
jgi:PTH1 family peptidyl-tRNA hydrolase